METLVRWRDWRRSLRRPNRAASEAGSDRPSVKGDASLKRNNQLVRRLKELKEETKDATLQEIASLQSARFVSECAVSLSEAKLKQGSDIQAAVEVASAMHQRYAEFAALLLDALQKSLVPDTANKQLLRQRNHLRFLAELVLVGVYDSDASVWMALKTCLAGDKDLDMLPLVTTFVKYCGVTFCGVIPNKLLLDQEDPTTAWDALHSAEDLVLPADRITAYMTVFTNYFNNLSKKLVEAHKRHRQLEREMEDFQHTRGELSEAQKTIRDDTQKRFERFLQAAQTMAESLNFNLPELVEVAPVVQPSSVIGIGTGVSGVRQERDLSQSPFEDEETRAFYEDLIDLRERLPAGLLENKQITPEVEVVKEEVLEADDGMELDQFAPEDENPLSPTDGSSNIDTLLLRLPTLLNRDLMDAAAVEFGFMSTKSNRNKLVRLILQVPHTRLDLFPYYSRLLATLHPVFPDMSSTVCQAVQRLAYGLTKNLTAFRMDSKIASMRLVSELVKFGVMPTHVPLGLMKRLLDELNGSRIEMLYQLCDGCGRYLLRRGETQNRMNELLDILQRKRNVMALDIRQSQLLEAAYVACRPPERVIIMKRPHSDLELYLHYLIHVQLSANTVQQITETLRRFPWNDASVVDAIQKIFLKIWKIKYANVHWMASIAAHLSHHYNGFGVWLVDAVLDEIQHGLEVNVYRDNQKRLSTVHYLGELFLYRLLEPSVIIETLYLILTLGHEKGLPEIGKVTPLDPPDDLFRVRLCCTLLQTCGHFFDRGLGQQRLDTFLVFLQYYMFTKTKVALDIEFLLSDVFETLRPKMVLFDTLEKCLLALNAAREKEMGSLPVDLDNTVVETEEMEESEEEPIDNDLEMKQEEIEEAIAAAPPVTSTQNDEEDAAFDAEFARVMNESLESRKSERRQHFDAPVPAKRAIITAKEPDAAAMSFTLLTKKGNKQQLRELVVPADASLAIRTQQQLAAERQEQQQLKQLVLGYEERESEARAEEQRTKLQEMQRFGRHRPYLQRDS